MLTCKATPKPVYAMTSSVSMTYAVIATVGNVLMALVILVDPYKQLRKRLNFWMLNVALAGLLLGGVVDGYRFYSNYLRAIGANVNDYIYNKPAFSKLCHIYLICPQIVYLSMFFTSLIDQVASSVFNVQLNKKVSVIVVGCVSLVTWSIAHSVGLMVMTVSYSDMELPMSASTAGGAGLGFILSYVLVYYHSQAVNKMKESAATVDEAEKDVQGNEDLKTVDLNESESHLEHTVATTNPADTAMLHLKNAKALCLSFLWLFLCTLAVAIVILLVTHNMYSSCLAYYLMKQFRLLLLASMVVWYPYVYIFVTPNVFRGILALLRIKRSATVAPAPQ